MLKKLIDEHNAQVDDFKRFKVGTVTVVDPNGLIDRTNAEYEGTLSNLNKQLVEGALGGYIHITHGADGADPIPTINYLADFDKVSTQIIEFGANLKNYTKTVKAADIATAVIPLGAEIDDEDESTENQKLTIASVNDGRDYVYSEEGVALYGWIFKTVEYDDETDAASLKAKAEEHLASLVQQNITIELNAIDLHLLDHSIESFSVGDYIRVVSAPHNFDSTLLCSKQTIDLLKPENDTLTLGYTYSTFTETSGKISSTVSSIGNIRSSVSSLSSKVSALNNTFTDAETAIADKILFNGSGACIATVFELKSATFTSGTHTADVVAHVPDGYTLVSCFAQFAKPVTAVIESAEITGTSIKLTARKSATSTYSGTAEAVRCFCICQKNQN
jgi:hypothetical protein